MTGSPRVTAELFQVPIALVSLVDAERQWFKSRVGLEVSETSRDVWARTSAVLCTKKCLSGKASGKNIIKDRLGIQLS